MKKLNLFALIFLCYFASAQEQASLNDFNFESTTNPAFTLLGEAPSELNTPDNLKALALYLSNGFSNTNIALEINPYWLLDFEEQRSYRSYRGIKTKNGKEYIDPFIGLKTNSSISIGFIDKKFEGFNQEKKTFAIGYRTTILQFYNADRQKKISDAIKRVETGVTSKLNILFQDYIDGNNDDADLGSGSCDIIDNNNELKNKYLNLAQGFIEKANAIQDPEDPDPDAQDIKNELIRLGREDITKEDIVLEYIKEHCPIIKNFGSNRKTIKPIFRLDGAIGYSVLFKENEINSSTANRFGSWLTADIALKFNDKNYLHIYAISKYIDDGFNIDSNGVYFNDNFWDIGGKIELEFNKLKLAYEYLKRSGDDDKFRSVGNLSYQLNKSVTISGGFGKDFPNDDNLVSILGINWGINLNKKSFTQN